MDRTGIARTSLSVAPFLDKDDFTSRWNQVDCLTLPHEEGAKYLIGFGSSDRAVEAALRLRYEIFNLELEEGLARSLVTGMDRDQFDGQMTHLLLLDARDRAVVGTYRMQPVTHGLANAGIYSAQEYDLSGFEHYFEKTLECGRACLALDHRNYRAMISMWLGMGAYMNLYGLQYVFGCCSLTTQDPDDGWRALKTIRAQGSLHGELYLSARAKCSCGPASRETDPDLGDAIKLPKLFRTYLRMGAHVISEPAIDRDFGTVDFLVLMDGHVVTFSRVDVVE